MGTVYSRNGILWIGYAGPDGRWHYRSSKLLAGQELEARTMLAAIEEEIRKGTRLASLGPLSVFEWGDRWQKERLGRVPKLWNAESEWSQVEGHALSIPVDEKTRFGRMRLTDVRPRHALALIRGLRMRELAPRTVANIWGTVHKLFEDAVIQELLTGNPMVLPDTERPRRVDSEGFDRSRAIFTRAESELLVSCPDLADDRRVLYAFALLAGLREGEIADRRWRDYDDAEPLGRLRVHSSYTRGNKRSKSTKTGTSREVPVHSVLAAILAQWKLSGWEETFGRPPREDDLIVPNRWGHWHTDDSVMKGLRRDLKALSLRPRRFHDMRRTFISLAISDGANRDMLRRITHGPKGDIIDQYSTFEWSALCAAVSKLKLGRRKAAKEAANG